MSTFPGITSVIHITLRKFVYHIKRQDSVIPSMYLYWDIYYTASYNTSSKNLETLNAFYSKSTFRRARSYTSLRKIIDDMSLPPASPAFP